MRLAVTPLFGIGDALMTTPALRVIKESRSDIHVTYFTFNRAVQDLMMGNPNIDELVHFPLLQKSKLEGLKFLVGKVTGKYDACINFYPSNRAAYNIFSFLTLAPRRIGHRYLNADISQLNWLKNRTIRENPALHCVQENIALVKFLGEDEKANGRAPDGASPPESDIPAMEVFLRPEEMLEAENYLSRSASRNGTAKSAKGIGIHAGSSLFKNHSHRRWPMENFASLIDRMEEFRFYLFGSPEDAEANRFILNRVAAKERVILVEPMPIRQVAAVIKNMDLFLSNDSGLMHLAAAVGTPVVALFGPTNPIFVRPWGVKHEVVKLELPCSPCFYYSPKPLSCQIGEKFKCLKQLPVEEVVKTIREFSTRPDRLPRMAER